MSKNKIRVGITLGDVNGIGCEIVIKALRDTRMLELFTPVIYGSGKALNHYKGCIEGGSEFHFTNIKSAKEARQNQINLIDCMGDISVESGKATVESGRGAVLALRAASKDIKDGAIDVMVTAPINKESVQGEDFNFTGHTEFLAAEFGGVPLMMMCSELLKVGLSTIHIPISEVAANITSEKIVATMTLLRKALITDFGIVQPRIAVLSLNPHSGDGGLLGTEEESAIRPAILQVAKGGILAFGPFSSDGFFASAGYTKYDAVLAMYHDQGLTPFKALTPNGVNFTAGLPVVRTSPDHGVAYDIAGQGVADETSMREAIYLAIDVFNSRNNFAEMSKNPLRRTERERGGKDLSVRDLIPEVAGKEEF